MRQDHTNANFRSIESAHIDSGIMFMFSHMTSKHGEVDVIAPGRVSSVSGPNQLFLVVDSVRLTATACSVGGFKSRHRYSRKVMRPNHSTNVQSLLLNLPTGRAVAVALYVCIHNYTIIHSQTILSFANTLYQNYCL